MMDGWWGWRPPAVLLTAQATAHPGEGGRGSGLRPHLPMGGMLHLNSGELPWTESAGQVPFQGLLFQESHLEKEALGES